MLALVKHSPGPGNVELRQVPEPRPGPGQVKIAIGLAGICGSDLHILHDRIALNLSPPVTMGHEFVGCVAEVGDGVEGWSPGRRVVAETAFSLCGSCRMCVSGHDNVCAAKQLIGYVHDGAFASSIVVPAARLHAAPAGVADSELAVAEPLAGCVHAIVEQCRVEPGDTVVVSGPGTIGLISLQIAKAMSCAVILVGRSRHRLELGVRLGADAVVDVDDGDPVDAIRAHTGGVGCDVFIECAGTAESADLGLLALRRRGRFLLQGLGVESMSVRLPLIAYKEIIVTGAMGQKSTAWRRALQLLARGAVDLEALVSDVLPLTEWERAFGLVESRAGHKVLLEPVR